MTPNPPALVESRKIEKCAIRSVVTPDIDHSLYAVGTAVEPHVSITLHGDKVFDYVKHACELRKKITAR